jgi:hypothetical protein
MPKARYNPTLLDLANVAVKPIASSNKLRLRCFRLDERVLFLASSKLVYFESVQYRGYLSNSIAALEIWSPHAQLE